MAINLQKKVPFEGFWEVDKEKKEAKNLAQYC